MPIPAPGDGGSGRIRTDTEEGLSLLTLPLAYAPMVPASGFEPPHITVLSRVTLPLAYAGVGPRGEI